MCFDICPVESRLDGSQICVTVVGGRAPLPSVKPRRLAAFVSRMPDVKGERCPLVVRSC
jgi:hypothetical protein